MSDDPLPTMRTRYTVHVYIILNYTYTGGIYYSPLNINNPNMRPISLLIKLMQVIEKNQEA